MASTPAVEDSEEEITEKTKTKMRETATNGDSMTVTDCGIGNVKEIKRRRRSDSEGRSFIRSRQHFAIF